MLGHPQRREVGAGQATRDAAAGRRGGQVVGRGAVGGARIASASAALRSRSRASRPRGQRVLRGEVVEQAALGHARGRGHGVERGGAGPGLDEERLVGVEDAVAGARHRPSLGGPRSLGAADPRIRQQLYRLDGTVEDCT